MEAKAVGGRGYCPVTPDTAHKRALRLVKGTATLDDRFIPDHEELVQLIGALRAMGCIIGFTTGVWDLFHLGHPEYIQRGREEVAQLYSNSEHIIMVVGADTDEFTRKRKGPNRPVVPQAERVRVLSHMRAVDIVTLQYEADQLFRVVEHDVRIVSTSTTDLPEFDVIRQQCAHLVNLPPQAETSTTARIRQLTLDGVDETMEKVERAFARALEEVRNEIKR